MADDSDVVWSFGIGSNMNVDIVENKKKIKVIDHACAVLTGWRLGFTLHGMEKVEPSFADAQRGGEADEIHGVVLALSQSDMENMDAQEGIRKVDPGGKEPTSGYAKAEVEVKTYDGRTVKAWVYTGRAPKAERPCSNRYLSILVNGAKDAGLNEDYVAQLAARPTYQPDQATVDRRKELPRPESLPPMTVAELEATKAPTAEEVAGGKAPAGTLWYLSTTGYVIKLPKEKVFFNKHRGRDITMRNSKQFRGISMDTDDDLGKPPFRVLAQMPEDEAEYVRMWRDHYIEKCGVDCIVAYLSEFLEETNAAAAALA